MQLIFVPAVIFIEISLVDFLQVVKVVRALWVDTFVDDEVLAVFLMYQRV